ncbi:Muramoyltetrapeptide carboxypeptidase LdcA (peptidoglycan recycling) [Psychrobacillus sp. OK028]|uniref:S66 family peptidase n=1 Tax=Psychrobacillus sp. OK028 TaxID=1884359 RepID=UPI00088117D0|nr:S66 peptidase family protein [Psychrobacillus sp. OK028]SDO17745.1 Muramoyltetrapeptide carboxypeptidase LdcA (peptidoglycan recycling) [Psychrobacillus sp. OK028]
MRGLNKLLKGDKIGIYSPSSPITYSSPVRFERAKKFLETKGFEILEGNLTGKHDFYRSGNIQERAEELNELIRNPEIHCIMSTIGGTNSNAVLPYIDYEAFKKNPKIMIGYSDATAILLAIYAQTGIPTFYGPALVPSFGEFEPYVNYTYDYFKDILIKEQHIPFTVPKPPYWTDEPINWEIKTEDKQLRQNDWICVNEGIAQGRLIGGNLNAMYGIWGSPYMPMINEGDILLIEDTMKSASVVEKNFNLLKLNGVFDRVSGIILGKHELFDDQGTGRKPADILVETIGNTSIPILADFDCCHTHPMLTMPIGCSVELNSNKKEITIMERWIE